MGVQSFVYYFLLYDVEARGFVRPFCLVYSTKEAGKMCRVIVRLREQMRNIVQLLKECNRRSFLGEVSEAIDSFDAVEHRSLYSYYGLYYDNNMNSAKKPFENSKVKNMQLYAQLQHARNTIKQAIINASSNTSCPQQHHINIDHWLAHISKGTIFCSFTRFLNLKVGKIVSCLFVQVTVRIMRKKPK